MDDVLKFMRREVRRGSKYDLIILDPPVFGRGPKGEIWRLEKHLAELAELSKDLFPKEPLGFLLNFYATTLYPHSVERVFGDKLGKQFPNLGMGTLYLEEKDGRNKLPTGYFLRS